MVGRTVSNARGDILGDEGELLGYVAGVEWPRGMRPQPGQSRQGQSPLSPHHAAPRSLFDLMGRATSSLMVDHQGNILDAEGKVVGRFHDNNNPLHRKEKEEREAREAREARERMERGEKPEEEKRASPPPTQDREQPQQETSPPGGSSATSGAGEGQPRPRRTEEERRANAEAWRKENPNESPSDIFLDVKSTREGIQLTIRIPTVFNGQQTTPHISFS
ncbi:hypothetical protein VTI74DRAFT_7449 [Chaetomium olivicolor]